MTVITTSSKMDRKGSSSSSSSSNNNNKNKNPTQSPSSASKNKPLLLLLTLCAVVVVVLNVSYLKHLGQSLDFQQSQQTENVPPRKASEAESLSDQARQKIRHTTNSQKSDKASVATVKTPPAVITNSRTVEAPPPEEENVIQSGGHRVAGLNCDKYGGPSEEIASEMVYWQDIPSDAEFVSPFANYGPNPKYLTFEPDEGGWNNIRMSMETATTLAHAMGRTLVLPPEQQMYLLNKDEDKKNNLFTFKDFFHFDSIAEEHPSVEVISMEEFMHREALSGHLKDKSGKVTFPPGNATTWDGHHRHGKKFWMWLRNATEAPIWSFDKCVATFPQATGQEAADKVKELRQQMPPNFMTSKFTNNPTPVDAPVKDRLWEALGDRRNVCVYGDHLQNVPVIHFMGDNKSGARLLTHFYAFLFFEDWRHDLWTKRFVRDHLRYVDEIQCSAAKLVHAIREKARENGSPDGAFDTFHIRRGDFQYKETRIDANEIIENVKDVLVENSTIFIATDERKMEFFEPFKKHYKVYFLSDFLHLVPDLNKNYYGMLDQRIASRGRTFVGAFFSTFSGYINRMRGYHSQQDKIPGYEKGELASYYYVPKRHKGAVRTYYSVKAPFWAREFPVGWRDVDHDLTKDMMEVARHP